MPPLGGSWFFTHPLIHPGLTGETKRRRLRLNLIHFTLIRDPKDHHIYTEISTNSEGLLSMWSPEDVTNDDVDSLYEVGQEEWGTEGWMKHAVGKSFLNL